MKQTTIFSILGLASCGCLSAQSLYHVGQESEVAIPLTWRVGANLIWDNNVNPTVNEGNPGYEEEQWSISPYVQANLTTISPQTTINFFASVGANFYLQEMESSNADSVTPDVNFGFDYNHSFSERLRFSTRNYFSYEMEPEYSYGLSNDRSSDPYFTYSSDNSIGYRWTQRVGSYTGISFTGYLQSDFNLGDRKSWSIYHQMRYQLTQRAVLTGKYRYEQWTGDASDSSNHYITAGLEYRLSQNSVFTGDAGIQLRDVEDGDSSASPYLQAAMRTQINSKFGIRGFIRYGMEDYDTVQFIGANLFEYSDQQVLRMGLTGTYALSPRLTGNGGIDFVHTAYDGGNQIGGPGPGPYTGTDEGRSEDLINLFIGLSAKFTDQLTGNCSINYTDSTSDFEDSNYDRLRLSMGVSYTF